MDFSKLKVVYINCTLKKSPAVSHTETLMKLSQNILEKEKPDYIFDKPEQLLKLLD